MAKQTYTTGQVLTAAQMTTLQTNDFNQTVSAKTASYTLVAADVGTRITMSNASATTVTVNTALFAAGDTLEITNIGAGICTVTAGTATVSTSSTLALKQFDSGQLYFTSTGVAIFFASDAADSAPGGLNPNLVINGNFTINQRGYVSAASLASGSYGFDRFKSNFTSTTLTFTSAPAGQPVTINSGGGLQQIVEQANVPAGTYTLSFAGTATGRIYNVGATPPAYAASPISFTADGLADVTVEFTATGATKTLSQIKLELGASATSYSYAGNTIAGELAACKRYYQVFKNGANSAVTGQAFSTAGAIAPVRFEVEMRVAPTIVLATLGSGSGQVTFVTSSLSVPATLGNLVADNISKFNFRLYQDNATSAFTAGNASIFTGVSADIYRADAEL